MKDIKQVERLKGTLENQVREYQQIILEEFWERAQQIERNLTMLNKEGVDEKRFIRVREDEGKEFDYTTIEDTELAILLQLFKEMDKKEEAITKTFELIKPKECEILIKFEEYLEMEKLVDAYNAVKRAEEELRHIIF